VAGIARRLHLAWQYAAFRFDPPRMFSLFVLPCLILIDHRSLLAKENNILKKAPGGRSVYV